MNDVMNKPPTTVTPPALPPYLTRKRGPERRRIVIMPDIVMADQVMRLPNVEKNWYTLVYRWMLRVDMDSGMATRTITSTRLYRQWLETYETDSGVPPHIAFGGAIESGEADPTFYPRWVEYAKEIFC